MADDGAVTEVTPRGGHAGERTRLAVGGLVLLLVSPVAVLCAAVTLVRVLGQVHRHWRDIAMAGAAVSAVGAVLLVLQVSLSGVPPLSGWVTETAVLGVPLGVAAGAGAVGLLEWWAAGAEWHPAERRRRAAEAVREAGRAAEVTEPDMVASSPVPVLGVFLGGDLAPWVRGDYVVPPAVKASAMGAIGESGSGKTETVKRLNWLWAHQKTRVIFADFKGSDPKLPEEVIAAYLDARPDASCEVWPAHPLDIWQGDSDEIAGRLMKVQHFSEPFYELAAKTAVRRAVEAPGDGPPRDSAEFLRRLDLGYLERAWKNTPQAADVAALKMPQIMEGVRMRYAGFFAALSSRFDHGFSWGDADLSVLTIPTLVEPDNAMAAARVILADFGAWCLNRKPRDQRAVLVVDEFSAVTEATPQVIDLAERIRDANGMIVICVQNFEGLGRDSDERSRMLDALQPGGLIVHRVGNPGKVLSMAGTTPETDMSWHLNPAGHTGNASVRLKERLSVPWNDVRRLRTGEAFVITHGRALRMNVIPTQIGPVALARARNLIERAGVPSC